MQAVAAALLALETAPAAEVVPAMREIVRSSFGGRDARVFLVDYRLRVLQSVGDEPPGPAPERRLVDASPEGRAFASGEVSVTRLGTGWQVLLPVSVRTNRLGVLAVDFDAEPTHDLLVALADLGRVLGHAITVAAPHTDEYEQAARAQRLSLAAEMQWQILPGRGSDGPDFELAGQLEPAYHVAGDAFDWCVGPDRITLSVHEGMGQGTTAAQATNMAVTALRNARRAGLEPADQARMADEALFACYGGRMHIESVLLELDRRSGRVRAVDAGSPMILRQRGRDLHRVELEKQLPLGRFSGTSYREDAFGIEPGDRLVIVSDGVHEAAGSSGDHFGEEVLPSVLRATRALPPAEAVRQVIRELRRHCADDDVVDDAVAVVLDWRPEPPEQDA